MRRLHPCTGCRYFFGRFEHNRCCNYIFVMGKRRPCPPGKLCTVREKNPGTGNRSSWRAYVPHRPRTQYSKTCPHCGSVFATTNSAQVYCCAACREAERNLRKQAARRARKAGTNK